MIALREALGHLSPDHRAVIALHLHEGYSVEETARLLAVPFDTVRSRLRAARRRLRGAGGEGPMNNRPAMTDERLDRLIRDVLADRAEDIAAATASAETMAERITARLRPSPVGRGWVLLAAALLAALLMAGTLVAGGVLRLPSLPSPGSVHRSGPVRCAPTRSAMPVIV